MTKCDRIGIAGDCGYDCPVFLSGDCELQAELLDREDFYDHYVEKMLEFKDEIKKNRKKIKELEAENEKLKNRFTRFEIMDFG